MESNLTEVLTEREMIVAKQITNGHTEKRIADILCISEKTVHNHAYNIRKKLNARGAVDIARKFILSFEQPQKHFMAIVLLIIQFHMVFDCATIELRKPVKSKSQYKTSRIFKPARRK